MRRVIFYFFIFLFFIFFSERAARAGGGGGGLRCQTFSFSFFPCSADHERDWPPCKVVFFGLATNALNVRNNNNYKFGMAISPTGGVFSYLPHHLDLASEDSVGHSTRMSVLARRRAIMGSIVQPKRSCLGAATGTADPHTGGANSHTYPTAKNPPTTPPLKP